MSTFFISPSGNDTTGDGSEGNPWLTVAKFLASAATSGDTCIAENGTYTISGANIKAISYTMQARNTGLAIFDAGGIQAYFSHRPASGTVTIQGIVFQNFIMTSTGIYNQPNINHVFVNCTFKDCTLFETGFGGGIINFINFAGSSVEFRACRFYNITGATGSECIVNTGSLSGKTVKMYNCTSYNVSHIIRGNSNEAVTLDVRNCIFSRSSSKAWRTTVTPSGTFDYNSTYNYTSVPSGSNNITTDPLLIDPANGNLNLRPTSPCLDIGTLV